MVERGDGHRLLLAPRDDVARYVGGIYHFDEVRVGPVEVERTSRRLLVDAGVLQVDVAVGRRTAAGWVLRLVPRRLATNPTWITVVDPLARLLRPGVRTRGATPGGRELYAATDEWAVTAVRASWDGADLGSLADVRPPVRFSFSSTPARPSLVEVVTTVRRPG